MRLGTRATNISEPRDWARVGRVLLERNVSSQFVIIAGIFRKNSARHYVVEHGKVVDLIENEQLAENKAKLERYLGV